jgi:hypothetical protein
MKTSTSGLAAAKARWPLAGTPFKRCPSCKKILSRDGFFFYNVKRGSFSSYCKECNKEKSKKREKDRINSVKYLEKGAKKLTAEDARNILEISPFFTTIQIAEKFGVSDGMIRRIITGKSWWWA